MAEVTLTSYPWDSVVDEESGVGDRDYTSDNFTQYFKYLFGDSINNGTGIVYAVLNQMNVSSVTGELKAQIDTGMGFIEGRMVLIDTAVEPDFVAPVSGIRYDRVVLKADKADRTIVAYVKEGTAGAPPALERAGDVFEISLFKLKLIAGMVDLDSIGCEIVDERADASVCGIINRLNENKVESLGEVTLPQLNGTYAGFTQNHSSQYSVCKDPLTDDIFVFGGYSSSPINFVSKYDHVDKAWYSMMTMITARGQVGTVEAGGLIYLIGGYTGGSAYSKKNEAYDILGNSHVAKTDKPTACGYPCCVVLGGYIYCFSGTSSSGYLTKLERYLISGDSWDTLASMPLTPTGYVSGCTNGTDIYLNFSSTYFYRYNVGSNNYTRLADTASQLSHMFYVDDYIWGFDGSNIYRYDITNDKWLKCTNNSVGWGAMSYPYMAVQLSDRRYTTVGYSGVTSKYYTYYYYLGISTEPRNLSIRKRDDPNLLIMNIDTQYSGNSVGFLIGDKYGIYVNLNTVTTENLKIELTG
jgi:hypothetical protein